MISEVLLRQLAPAAWASDLFRRQGHFILLQLLQYLMLPVTDTMIVMVSFPADVKETTSCVKTLPSFGNQVATALSVEDPES